MRKVVSPGGATKPAATFKVGDKVVFYPTGVMTVTAIAPHKQVDPDVTSDELVYALRLIGEERDLFFIGVKATTRPPLRHISTKSEIATFLAVLGDELQNARVTPPPPDVMKEIFAAGNDLLKLARLVPYMRETDQNEREKREVLRTFFAQELAVVRGIDERDARAILDHL